jgi:hypothetical protein
LERAAVEQRAVGNLREILPFRNLYARDLSAQLLPRCSGPVMDRARQAPAADAAIGILHGCLRTGALHEEDTAWAHIFHRAL